MRKLFLLLIFFSAVQLYSQSADYPDIINNGTIFINAGVGFGQKLVTETSCPPLTISMDIAIPVFGFPMSLGIIAGYFSESGSSSIDTNNKPPTTTKTNTELSCFLVAGRIAYHLNFFKSLQRLDTYVLMTIGGIIGKQNDSIKVTVGNSSTSTDSRKEENINDFWFGIGVGARYFFTPAFGAFIELGLDKVQNLNFGVSFKL